MKKLNLSRFKTISLPPPRRKRYGNSLNEAGFKTLTDLTCIFCVEGLIYQRELIIEGRRAKDNVQLQFLAELLFQNN